MNKKSDIDILVEQCIQDVNNEYLEEGFVDNIKAGFNGAKEWLKADARNSFKLRNKNDMKNDRRWSARKGKVSSYAKSIANTLQDYKKSGGTLGRGMKVDDVISRLNQVAQGKYPRGKAQNSPQNQPTQEQPQQNNKQQSSEIGNTPEAKGPSFKEKAGNVLSTGAKKVKDTVAKGYNNLKDKVSAPKKSQTTTPVSGPDTPSTSQSQATKQPSKKVLSPSEKAKKAIAKAQANVQKARANAPKLNLPNAGKPIKRRRIVNAKQRKDIDAATKEMEDFHRSLGDTGAEWEERIHESYYGSNTQGQLSMLNSIR